MLDQEWGLLGAAVIGNEDLQPTALSTEEFTTRLHAALQGTHWPTDDINGLATGFSAEGHMAMPRRAMAWQLRLRTLSERESTWAVAKYGLVER